MDIYLLERLHKLLHGPINVFDREGNLIHSFEEGVCQPVAPREFQGKGKEKPYIKMDGKGVGIRSHPIACRGIYCVRQDTRVLCGRQ